MFLAHKLLWTIGSLPVVLLVAIVSRWVQSAPVLTLGTFERWFDSLPSRSGKRLGTIAVTSLVVYVAFVVVTQHGSDQLKPATTATVPAKTVPVIRTIKRSPRMTPAQQMVAYSAQLAATRRRYHLSTLTRSSSLDASAFSRLEQLRIAGKLTGSSPKPASPGSYGELLAWSTGIEADPAALTVASWLASKGERGTLLGRDWRSYGIAVANVEHWGSESNVTLTVIELSGV